MPWRPSPQLRVGYLAASADWSAPADRRRFIAYARARGLKVEHARPDESYDVVVLSQAADLTVWQRYDRAPIVYECIDSYILPPHDARGRLRGALKFLTRQHRRLQWRYDRSVQLMCARASAVVCSTDTLRRNVLPFCPNVHIVLDVFDKALRTPKQDYRPSRPFAIVWEGLAAGAAGRIFPYLAEAVAPMLAAGDAHLHVVTDITYPRLSARFGRAHTADAVRRVFGPLASRVSLYQWSEVTFASLVTACDLAVIPIPPGDPYVNGKPENKLVLLWRTGIPVVTSATPAYRDAMERCGVPLVCENLEDWHRLLPRVAEDESLRHRAAEAGRRLAETEYSCEQMLQRWDRVMESVLG